jgi:hypothetical protein
MSEQKKPVWYENKIKRNAEYNKNNTVRLEIKINRNTEAEILEHLEQIPNKSGYIKQLIIEDIAKKKI